MMMSILVSPINDVIHRGWYGNGRSTHSDFFDIKDVVQRKDDENTCI